MLDFLIPVVAGADAVLHYAEPDLASRTPLDEMVAECARLHHHRRIVQVPDIVLEVVLALEVAVMPSAIAAVAASLQMPSRAMGHEGQLAGPAVLENQADIAAHQGLHRP